MKEHQLTKLEKYWILYDVGNSAFILLVTTIMPIYFNALTGSAGLSEVDALAYWGYGASVSTLIVALIGPVLGTIADTRGYKKPVFALFVMIGAVGCAVLSFPSSWLVFLGIYLVAKVGYSASLIFYDAMLGDVTTPERMDMISSHGYAWGYLGSCIPFLISLILVLFAEPLSLTLKTSVMLAFFINGAWWLCSAVPLLRNYKQIHYVETEKQVVRASFQRLKNTLKEIKQQKKIFLFLLSFFFYIDGVYTIIEMATAYGSAVGLEAQGLLLALLLTQIVAFPFALTFGKLAKKYPTEKLIQICILAYVGIVLFAIQLDRQWEFWLLAVCVGMFQGAVQALSRSYFAKIIPPEKSGEFFGIFDICGKGASFMGTALMGMLAQATGSPGGGIAILAVMFLVGLILLRKAVRMEV